MFVFENFPYFRGVRLNRGVSVRERCPHVYYRSVRIIEVSVYIFYRKSCLLREVSVLSREVSAYAL